MTITRVIRDGVEFFTIDATGESGMSESGLAILCGVSHQAVNKFLRDRVATKRGEIGVEAMSYKSSRLQPKGLTSEERSYISNLSIVRAEVCAEVIWYYAFDSRNKTPEALYACQRFMTQGITAWIQEITEWHGNPVPKAGVVIDFKTLDLLLDSKLDAAALRLYLYLTKAKRLRFDNLKTEQVINGANLSRSTFSSAATKLQALDLLPDWCKIQRRQQPEKIVRDRLQSQIGGQAEAPTPWGPIDLLTDTEIIEVKIVNRWKEALGHLLVKSESYPDRQRRLHLYGSREVYEGLDRIQSSCRNMSTIVTYEFTPTRKALV
jgi:hypothetical protein